jgi:hypothetical protein
MAAIKKIKVVDENCTFQSTCTEEHFFIYIKWAAVCNAQK